MWILGPQSNVALGMDEKDTARVDRILDLMDRLWYGLYDEEHKFLDSRGEIQPTIHLLRKT
jgi:hypothetical protein